MTNLPVPYRMNFFEKLGKVVDLTVTFELKSAKGRNKDWLQQSPVHFKAFFLEGIERGEEKAFCPQIINIIDKEQFDEIVVGAYHTPTAMLAIQYMKMKKYPYYISSDGGFIKQDFYLKKIVKSYFMKGAKGYFSPGSKTDEYLIYYGAARNKIFRYPFTSIDESDILAFPLDLESKIKYKKELGIKEEKIILGVGQIIYRKGWDVLLKAACEFFPEVGIYIVGGFPTDDLSGLIQQYDLRNVYFVDFQNKEMTSKYYMASDIFILPTREDIWGLVINEAMGYGLPVITTDKCMAGLELIEDEKNGYLIHNIDSDECVKQIREKLQELLNNDSKRAEFSRVSLQKIAHYTIKNMVHCYSNVLCGESDEN